MAHITGVDSRQFITVLLPEVPGAGADTDSFPTVDRVIKMLTMAHSEGRVTGKPVVFKNGLAVGTALEHAHTPAYQITFIAKSSETGVIVERLIRIGVGSEYGYGSINVIPLEYHRSTQSTDIDLAPVTMSKGQSQQGKWLASQLRIEHFIQSVEHGTALSFDFVALLVIASVLAGIGLAMDNTVVIVASMLVSPLMGPVLAVTLGTSVLHTKMVKTGLVTGFVAIMVCLAVGFVTGVVASFFDVHYQWPTHEMSSRGDKDGLLVGFAIAVASGIGVALSGLSQNTSSLVGVAISASLLPPAVNAGMCWAYALLGTIISGESVDRQEYTQTGIISVSLTLLNIVSVFCTGLIVFRFKARLKIRDRSTADLEGARRYYQTLRFSPAERERMLRVLPQSTIGLDEPAATTDSMAPSHAPVIARAPPANTPQTQPAKGALADAFAGLEDEEAPTLECPAAAAEMKVVEPALPRSSTVKAQMALQQLYVPPEEEKAVAKVEAATPLAASGASDASGALAPVSTPVPAPPEPASPAAMGEVELPQPPPLVPSTSDI